MDDLRRSRRSFLRGSAGIATALATGMLARPAAADDAQALGPAAFDVSDRDALVWVRAGAAGQAHALQVSTTADFAQPAQVAVQNVAVADETIRIFDVSGLAADTEYFARAMPAGEACRFRTAPVQPRALSFVVSADTLADRKPFRLFDVMLERKPEFFLHLGDTIYSDRPKSGLIAQTLPQYRKKHFDVRVDSHMRRFMAAVPTFAIWDDHEVEDNFDRDHPRIPIGRQAFREWYPMRTPDPTQLYRRFAWGPLVDFFMLDTRQYRSSWKMGAEDPAKTMLGAEQKAWLLRALGASKAPFKILLSPSPFNGASQTDTWAGFKAERAEIDRFVQEKNLKHVMVLSGDWHMALDFSRRGTSLDEVVVGPIAAWPQFEMNPRYRSVFARANLTNVGDAYNFGHVRLEPAGAGAKLTIDIVDDKGDVRFSKSIEA